MSAQNIVVGVIAPEQHKFSVKNEILRFSCSEAGSVTQWIGSESTQYEWGFEKGLSALATGFENSQ